MLPPESLKERYDRLSFRVTAGLKTRLTTLARRAEVLPTQWIEDAISFPLRLTPTARMQLAELADNAECSPTAWLEGSIARAFASQIGGAG
jgi:predicted transcriptional regulator